MEEDLVPAKRGGMRRRPGAKKGGRRTEAVLEKIISEGAARLLERPTETPGDFSRWVMAKYNYESKKGAYNIRKKCLARLAQINDKNIEATRMIRVAQLNRMLVKAQKNEDIRMELQIMQELNRVDNLYVQRHEVVQQKDKDIFKIAPEEVELKKID